MQSSLTFFVLHLLKSIIRFFVEELKAHVRSSVSSETPFHGHAFPSCHLSFHPKKKRVRGNALHQNKTVLLRPPLCLPKQNRGLGNWGPLLVLRSVLTSHSMAFGVSIGGVRILKVHRITIEKKTTKNVGKYTIHGWYGKAPFRLFEIWL